MRSILAAGTIALGSSLAGCELDEARYIQDGELGGDPAIPVQLVPRERPAGRVRVDVLRATELTVPRFGALTVVTVRLQATNEADDQAWIIDARHQRIELPGGRRFAAMTTTADPVQTIARHRGIALDLGFALPATVDATPTFDVLWQLTTAGRIVGERTRFTR
jgi:hypothetical protein